MRCYFLILSFVMGSQCTDAQTFFESTWAAALGNSDNAVRDGGNWDINEGNGTYVEVRPISGPDLPIELANLNMATVSLDGDQGWQMIVENVNTNTADDFYFRYYIRVKPADGFQYAQLHPWQDFQDLPDGLSTNFYFGISTVNSSIWRPAFWTYAEQEEGMPVQFGVIDAAFGGPEPEDQLKVNEWYRIEGHLHYVNRVSIGSGIPYAETIYSLRIFDNQNNQVLSNEDLRGEFCDASGCTYHTLQSYYDQGYHFRFRSTSSTFTMGVNSPAGASGQGEIYDMAAAAFSNTDWVGMHCSSEMECDTITHSNSEIELEYAIDLFPNPVSDILTVQVSNQNLQKAYIHFIDINGKLIKNSRIKQGENLIDVAAFANGVVIYFIEEDGVRFRSGRIVKI